MDSSLQDKKKLITITYLVDMVYMYTSSKFGLFSMIYLFKVFNTIYVEKIVI